MEWILLLCSKELNKWTFFCKLISCFSGSRYFLKKTYQENIETSYRLKCAKKKSARLVEFFFWEKEAWMHEGIFRTNGFVFVLEFGVLLASTHLFRNQRTNCALPIKFINKKILRNHINFTVSMKQPHTLERLFVTCFNL